MSTMRATGLAVLFVSVALGSGCQESEAENEPERLAEQFIDAFYRWDPVALSALVVPGKDLDRVLYYQAWAQAANYEVLTRRPCTSTAAGTFQCAITVTDDFGQALGYTATDTFTLAVADGRIAAVSFEGDDPPVFEAVFTWMSETRPEVFAGPCLNMFDGGETPGACAQAVAEAARAYAALNQ